MKSLKHLQSVVLVVILLTMVLGMIAIDHRNDARSCNSVSVKITDDAELGFVSDADVIAELTRYEGGVLGKQLDDINMELFENKLNSNQHVSNAEVYSTIDGVVHVKLKQRRPIIRLICSNHEQFYLDENGFRMPVSDNFSAPVLLANGNIPEPVEEVKSVFQKEAEGHIVQDIFQLASWIDQHTFWQEMVQQVYIGPTGDMSLITRVGDQKVVIGNADNLDEKFAKLIAFYKGGLNRTGWNLYSEINLKFEDQVVCRKN